MSTCCTLGPDPIRAPWSTCSSSTAPAAAVAGAPTRASCPRALSEAPGPPRPVGDRGHRRPPSTDLEQQRDELTALQDTPRPRGQVRPALPALCARSASSRRQGRELRAAQSAYEQVDRVERPPERSPAARTAEAEAASRLAAVREELAEQSAVARSWPVGPNWPAWSTRSGTHGPPPALRPGRRRRRNATPGRAAMAGPPATSGAAHGSQTRSWSPMLRG